MATPLTLQTIFGLYGPNSPSVPTLGDKTTLNILARDVAKGLHIVFTPSANGLSESSHAIEMAINHLKLAGRVPVELDTFRGFSRQQCEALGLEPLTLHPSTSTQNLGAPPFKELDIGFFLAILRFAARCQQLKTNLKPVFQVGVVTMTVQGSEQSFFAQTIPAENGNVTDTVWLFRWIIVDFKGEYQEHWSPFDVAGDASLAQQQQQQYHQPPQQAAQYPPIAQAADPSTPPSQQQTPPAVSTYTSPPKRKRKRNPQHQTPPTKRPRRPQPYELFDHRPLSDDELFAKPSSFIQGDAILRLAEKYSNGQIFARIQAEHPGQVSAVNIITKRLTNAIDAQAKKEGVEPDVVRARIYDAKEANGVAHKAKLDVTPYG